MKKLAAKRKEWMKKSGLKKDSALNTTNVRVRTSMDIGQLLSKALFNSKEQTSGVKKKQG